MSVYLTFSQEFQSKEAILSLTKEMFLQNFFNLRLLQK